MQRLVDRVGGQWHVDSDGGRWEVMSNGFLVCAEPVVKQLIGKVSVAFDVAIEHTEFADLARRILGDRSTFIPLRVWDVGTTVESESQVEGALETQMNAIAESPAKEALETYLRKLASERPDRPSLAQVNHLAALAWTGDFNTLDDYLQLFKRGRRLNFSPMISIDAIDRAVDIAAERMK